MVKILGQQSLPWGPMKIGNSKDETIAEYGCLLTCYAMMAGMDPDAMNQCRIRTGGFLHEPFGAWSSGPNISACAPNVRITGFSPYCKDPVPNDIMQALYADISHGIVAVIMVDPTPQSVGIQDDEQHFVLADALDETGGLVINDPWYGDRVALRSRYGRKDSYAIYKFVTYSITAEVGNALHG